MEQKVKSSIFLHMKSDCQICGEEVNKSTKKIIKCNFCHYEACSKCIKRYLLSESISKCMNCKKEWPRKFIRENMTVSFMNNELKNHYEDILKQREIALLPEAQNRVENEKLISVIKDEIESISQKYHEQIRILESNIYEIKEKSTKNKKTNFVRSCPEENCKGFLNQAYRCGICDKYTCSKCHIVKGLVRDIEHTCDPDNVATATLLSHDTKPCPTCGMGIFKISGCLQMFCTQCRTAFSWKTGAIEINIHNPHYYEWMREAGREIPRAEGDNPCGNMNITHNTITSMTKNIRDREDKSEIKTSPENIENNKVLLRMIRKIIEFNAYPLVIHEYNPADNMDLRHSYILNAITEDEFKKQLQRRNKRNLKNNEIVIIKRLTNETLSSIVLEFIQVELSDPKWSFDYSNLFIKIDNIYEMSDKFLKEIAITYGCKAVSTIPFYRDCNRIWL